ncbi:MAG TPA: PEP-CTERM sorting domain-containing protein [Pirellulales bacterium]|jgi:hypothetical protein
MTTSCYVLPRAQKSLRSQWLAPAFALCGLALLTSTVQADPLTFTVDSTQSYLTLNIPNFSLSGLTINLTAQNRTNGAPAPTAWSANSTTGNTAFVSGTFATTIGGSLSGQSLSSIQFIAGANNLAAIASGNYRPNPAAYNSTTSHYDNNSGAPGAYGSTVHSTLGNAGLVSFDNVTYDIGSNNLPASGGVGSGTFATGADLSTGILSSVFSAQGLSVIIAGQVLPNDTGGLSGVSAPNTLASANYTFTSPTNLQVVVPVNIPISIDLGGGTFINGTAFGQFVGNAAVPEPSTLALAGLGMVSLVAMVRRRRNAKIG